MGVAYAAKDVSDSKGCRARSAACPTLQQHARAAGLCVECRLLTVQRQFLLDPGVKSLLFSYVVCAIHGFVRGICADIFSIFQ